MEQKCFCGPTIYDAACFILIRMDHHKSDVDLVYILGDVMEFLSCNNKINKSLISLTCSIMPGTISEPVRPPTSETGQRLDASQQMMSKV